MWIWQPWTLTELINQGCFPLFPVRKQSPRPSCSEEEEFIKSEEPPPSGQIFAVCFHARKTAENGNIPEKKCLCWPRTGRKKKLFESRRQSLFPGKLQGSFYADRLLFSLTCAHVTDVSKKGTVHASRSFYLELWHFICIQYYASISSFRRKCGLITKRRYLSNYLKNVHLIRAAYTHFGTWASSHFCRHQRNP